VRSFRIALWELFVFSASGSIYGCVPNVSRFHFHGLYVLKVAAVLLHEKLMIPRLKPPPAPAKSTASPPLTDALSFCRIKGQKS
jgi:hypothetical protein